MFQEFEHTNGNMITVNTNHITSFGPGPSNKGTWIETSCNTEEYPITIKKEYYKVRELLTS